MIASLKGNHVLMSEKLVSVRFVSVQSLSRSALEKYHKQMLLRMTRVTICLDRLIAIIC